MRTLRDKKKEEEKGSHRERNLGGLVLSAQVSRNMNRKSEVSQGGEGVLVGGGKTKQGIT